MGPRIVAQPVPGPGLDLEVEGRRVVQEADPDHTEARQPAARRDRRVGVVTPNEPHAPRARVLEAAKRVHQLPAAKVEGDPHWR